MLDTAAAGLVLTGEDKEIVDMVHDFVLKEVRPKAAEHDISGELDWDAYNKAFEMGLVCACLLYTSPLRRRSSWLSGTG